MSIKQILVGAVSAVALTAVGLSIAGDDVAKRIAEKLPAVDVNSITKSPINGIYEVGVGAQVAYVTEDGKHLITGQIIDLDTQVNLTEERLIERRSEVLASIDPAEMIVFSPKTKKHSVTVFTDIDCGYCRKLHREMDSLNGYGIEVRYLFFPRGGPGSPSWKKADDVFCAPDRQGALTAAKAGQEFETEPCSETPVANQYDLGQQVGLRGTPMIITESGTIINGYRPANRLYEQLEAEKAAASAN